MSFTVDEALLTKCLRHADLGASKISIKKYECNPFGIAAGTTFTSDIFSVWVEYECDGKLRTEHLVFKVPYTQSLYKMMKEAGFYDKETYIYDTIIPKLVKILPLSVVPKYYTTESDVLVLEDLTKQGYVVEDGEPWNFDQSVKLLEGLAEFHAASVKLNQLHPADIQKISSDVTLFRKYVIRRTTKYTFPPLAACLEGEKVNSRELRNLGSYMAAINEGDIFTIANRRHDFNVLVHANLKSNNLLLKRDESDKLTAVKIIDYQTCVWNSPVFDLLYFCVFTMDYEVFEEHHEQLVDRYLSVLNENLSNLNCGCTYSKDEYRADLEGTKLFQVFLLMFVGFFNLSACIPGFCLETNIPEVHSLEEIETISRHKIFRRRFIKWFRYFERQGYFGEEIIEK